MWPRLRFRLIRFRLKMPRLRVTLTKRGGFRGGVAAAAVLVGIYKKSEREEI